MDVVIEDSCSGCVSDRMVDEFALAQDRERESYVVAVTDARRKKVMGMKRGRS